MDKNLALDVLWVTEDAAIKAAKLRGSGNKIAADQAATTAMREALNLVPINGKVVIGEGEMDEAPMLYIGEPVGMRRDVDSHVDIAVDPLEDTEACANNGPGSVTVIALAADGCFLHGPDMYMEKIAVGKKAKGVIDITKGATWNLHAVAEALGKRVNELNAVMLNRERHKALIEEVRAAGAAVQLIPGGDLMAALATGMSGTGIDILFGSGGAPEGVIAAAALRCVGGDMQGILRPENDAQAARAASMTKRPIDHVYTINEMASGHVMFAATGVTDGPILKGVRFESDGITTHSIVMRSMTGSVRRIERFNPSTPPT